MVFVLVCLCPTYCVPNVASVSVVVLRIVYPMSPVSLSLSYVLYTQCRQCLCLCPTYCVPNVASVSVFVLRIVYPMSPVSLSLSYVLCTKCRQCLCLCPTYCVPNVASVSELSILDSLTFILLWYTLTIIFIHIPTATESINIQDSPETSHIAKSYPNFRHYLVFIL